MITYEEFQSLVKNSLANNLTQLSREQLDEYINSEESQEVIKNEYEQSKNQLKCGEITEQVFKNGSVGAASYCLYMLY